MKYKISNSCLFLIFKKYFIYFIFLDWGIKPMSTPHDVQRHIDLRGTSICDRRVSRSKPYHYAVGTDLFSPQLLSYCCRSKATHFKLDLFSAAVILYYHGWTKQRILNTEPARFVYRYCWTIWRSWNNFWGSLLNDQMTEPTTVNSEIVL